MSFLRIKIMRARVLSGLEISRQWPSNMQPEYTAGGFFDCCISYRIFICILVFMVVVATWFDLTTPELVS